MSNLIVGMASGYNWRQLEPFVVSLRKVYDGRCVLILGDGPHDIPDGIYISREPPTDNLHAKLAQYNIDVFDLGKFEEHPILARFPTIAGIIGKFKDLGLVLACDTKDIIFQSDPFAWLEQHLGKNEVCAVEEGVTYASSWGNRNNCLMAFGQDALTKLFERRVMNGGVIAGRPDAVRQLCLDIHALCQQDRRRAYSNPGYADMLPDQSALNILGRGEYADKMLTVSAKDGFCYLGNQGEVGIDDGLVHPPDSQMPYSIVHQYFRLDPVKELINAKYRESE